MNSIVLEEFFEEIQKIEDYIQHIEKIDDFTKKYHYVKTDTINSIKQHLLKYRTEKKIFEYKSLIISLYGLLENYISEIIQEHILNISNIFNSYSDIPKKLSQQHFTLSIRLISILDEKRYHKYSDIDKYDILKILHNCVIDKKNYNLNKEAFIPSSGNLKHSKIVESFNIIDIKLDERLKINIEFKKFLETIFVHIDHLNSNELYEKINDLVERRNEIAHSNNINNLLSINEIRDYIVFLRSYAKALYDILLEKEIEYEKLYSYKKIDNVINIFGNSILAFELEYDYIQKDDYIIVKYDNSCYKKLKILELQKDNIPYQYLIANKKIKIAVNLGSEFKIRTNQEFYIKRRDNMTNILRAFINIIQNPIINLVDYYQGRNRINNSGKALENYIQDVFAGTLNEDDENQRLQRLEEVFSYQGNQNNPPDLILRSSDAIEVKKLQSKNSAIALNSSYPKAKLYASSPMITNACRSCEDWEEKDIIYTIGYTDDNALKSLWLVYGDCFCADREIYERIKDTISDGINSIPDVEFTQTNELGKVKKVDPLGITDLRIRGMWHIDNPNKIFDYLYEFDDEANFQVICLMKTDKYNSMPQEDRTMVEDLNNDNIIIQDVMIKNPNNPIQLIDAKLITFKVL